MSVVFHPRIQRGEPPRFNVPDKEIRRLPQFFRGSPEYVYRLGGWIYRWALDRAPLDGSFPFVTVDSRVHMLMPGMWPCIPGWHCDDFYRPGGGQPDLRALVANTANVRSLHHAVIFGQQSPTQWLAESVEISDAALDSETVYRDCAREIDAAPRRVEVSDEGQFVTFDSITFHRGTKALGQGWRLFVRITESTHYAPANELRTQTQVYLDDPSAGW